MMSSLVLSTVINSYRRLLQPIPPFTWFGTPISVFDVAAALRLCIVMRQLREMGLQHYQRSERARKSDANGSEVKGKGVEDASLVRNIAVTLVVVYGGEAIMNPWLGVSPSFVLSPIFPALYAGLQTLVDRAPWVPAMSFKTEFPLSLFDGLTRAFLLCQLIPPVVTNHSSALLANSPWTLLLTSLITANGGFFFVNLFSMLHPIGWSVTTPAELQAYGWTTIDLWCAPVTTALYALLTHAQPFWAELHALLLSWATPYVPSEYYASLGISSDLDEKAKSVTQAVDSETARAACAIFLTALFVSRTMRNFGGQYLKESRGEKKKVIRARGDGRKLKVKIQ